MPTYGREGSANYHKLSKFEFDAIIKSFNLDSSEKQGGGNSTYFFIFLIILGTDFLDEFLYIWCNYQKTVKNLSNDAIALELRVNKNTLSGFLSSLREMVNLPDKSWFER